MTINIITSTRNSLSYSSSHSAEELAGKGRQDEARSVNLLVVVPAEFLLFLGAPAAERLLDVSSGVFAADHEADLARGVGGDGGIGVLDHGKDLLAVFLELGDEW